MAEEEQFCTFYLGSQCFGLSVLRVQEVIRHQEMTPVPLAHSAVRGLINLRGQIVPAIDLRARMGLPARTGGELPLNVVVRTDDGAVSLLVDEIGDVLQVPARSFERPPDTLDGPARDLIRWACKLEGGLLLVLDTDRTVNLSSHSDPPGGARN